MKAVVVKWRCFIPCLLVGALRRDVIRCPHSKPHDIQIAQSVGYRVGGPVFEFG